jgi:acylphosphatase
VIVRGRVQGVGFRFSTQRRAAELGAAGWVRNRADGSVEAVFEGDPASVDAMLAFCRTGPRHALVDSVDEREEAPEGLRSFEVR